MSLPTCVLSRVFAIMYYALCVLHPSIVYVHVYFWYFSSFRHCLFFFKSFNFIKQMLFNIISFFTELSKRNIKNLELVLANLEREIKMIRHLTLTAFASVVINLWINRSLPHWVQCCSYFISITTRKWYQWTAYLYL